MQFNEIYVKNLFDFSSIAISLPFFPYSFDGILLLEMMDFVVVSICTKSQFSHDEINFSDKFLVYGLDKLHYIAYREFLRRSYV